MTDYYVLRDCQSGHPAFASEAYIQVLLLGLHRRAAASAASIADFRRHRNETTLFAVRQRLGTPGTQQTSGRPGGTRRLFVFCWLLRYL